MKSSNIQIATESELEAYNLLLKNTKDTRDTYTSNDAGNDIIVLAEKIKAERAVSAMYGIDKWKRKVPYNEFYVKEGEKTKWFLGWYGPSSNPNECSIDFRKIVIKK